MTALTPANQLTLLRMFLIPASVILVVYGYLGWALAVFVLAGITDALDGLMATLTATRQEAYGHAHRVADTSAASHFTDNALDYAHLRRSLGEISTFLLRSIEITPPVPTTVRIELDWQFVDCAIKRRRLTRFFRQ